MEIVINPNLTNIKIAKIKISELIELGNQPRKSWVATLIQEQQVLTLKFMIVMRIFKAITHLQAKKIYLRHLEMFLDYLILQYKDMNLHPYIMKMNNLSL